MPGDGFIAVWLLSLSPVVLCFCCLNVSGIIGTCCRLPRFTLFPSILTVFAYGDMLFGGGLLTLALVGGISPVTRELEMIGASLVGRGADMMV